MPDLIDGMIKKLGLGPIVRKLVEASRQGNLCIEFDHRSVSSPFLSEGKDDNPFPKTPLIFQGNRLYLQRNWAFETLVFQQIRQRSGKAPSDIEQKAQFVQALGQSKGILSPCQQHAILKAFEHPLAVFTGGPGTGKTYTAAHFIRLLASLHPTSFKVAIGAPTGKAASRLEEVLISQNTPASLTCKAATLHRLLSIYPGSHRIGSPKKLEADLVVVDEASMLDHLMMAHLLEALPKHGRLLLLGDVNQLPPVESGSFFADMAALFGSCLTESHRMQQTDLQKVARLICDGEGVVEALKESGNWIEWTDLTIDLLADWLKVEGRKILTPLRRGPFGVEALNTDLKAILRWSKVPILITENDPKNQLWNGMSGTLAGGFAHFEDRKIPLGMLPSFEEAFSISIHKSQGSEYEEVLVLFPPGTETFGKEALYTAVTRAKKRVVVASTEETIRNVVASKEAKRSGLLQRFKLSL